MWKWLLNHPVVLGILLFILSYLFAYRILKVAFR